MATPSLPPAELAQNQGPQIIAVISVMTALATLAVVLRLVSRHMVSAPLWWDDYVILLALLFNFGTFANVLTSVFFGLGKHVEAVPPAHTVTYLQLVYAYEIQYTILIMTIKLSILLMYHRIFATPGFRKALKVLFAAVILWGFGTTVAAIFECSPPSHLWDTTSPGTCVNLVNLFIATAAINIATDIIMVVMPMPMVWRLKIPYGQKIALCGVFALASFVCIASIVRISILDQVNFADPTWGTILSEVWSVVEPCCGITSACLPSMRPLYNRVMGHPINGSSSSALSQRYNSYGAGGGGTGYGTSSRKSSAAANTLLSTLSSSNRNNGRTGTKNFSRVLDDQTILTMPPEAAAARGGANGYESKSSRRTSSVGGEETVNLDLVSPGGEGARSQRPPQPPPERQIWKTVDIEMKGEGI